MNTWEVVDSATVPGGDGVLSLHRFGDEYVIFIDHRRLMGSSATASEKALATLAGRHLASRSDPVVLIGGLGMGQTLREALAVFPETARVVVAELVPAVVRWNRECFGALSDHAMDDARVEVRECDVATCIKDAADGFDAILLDVDNGPNALTRASNEWLYSQRGLRVAFDALRPGGVLNVWSSTNDDVFTERLEDAGFDVHVEMVNSNGPDPGVHTIWVAVRKPTTVN